MIGFVGGVAGRGVRCGWFMALLCLQSGPIHTLFWCFTDKTRTNSNSFRSACLIVTGSGLILVFIVFSVILGTPQLPYTTAIWLNVSYAAIVSLILSGIFYGFYNWNLTFVFLYLLFSVFVTAYFILIDYFFLPWYTRLVLIRISSLMYIVLQVQNFSKHPFVLQCLFLPNFFFLSVFFAFAT